MQSANQLVLPNEIVGAGVDWITATAKTGSCKYDMGVLATNVFQRAMDADEKVEVAKRQGYTGYSTNHFFHGERHGGAMMIASSAKAADLWRSIQSVSDNISRVDLQVTVYTILEQPHVARIINEQIKRGELGMIPIRNATYIEGHPDGETININKRVSDCCARVYDKASESGMGIPRTVWRYEVECRRGFAKSAVSALRAADHDAPATMSLVHTWFTRRGVKPLFDPGQDFNALTIQAGRRKGDTISWFRDTLSKTVATQVRLHGRAVVLDALGLVDRTNSRSEEVS